MYKIKTLNKISPLIHDVLSANQYMISDGEEAPDGILVRSASMHEMTMPASLLAVARAGAGVNNIPLDKCSEEGIVVFNTPGANANAVAELVMAGLLLSNRDIIGGTNWAQGLKGQTGVDKLVEKGKAQFVGPELKGKRLAVIGLGAIGALVANIASQGFGMEVVGYDPYISIAHAWSLSRAVRHANTIEEAVKDADYITLHIPLMSETKGMINAAFIASLKDGVRIMNFSRAELANFDDVKDALNTGKLGCYVTDFPTDALLGVKNLICLPHLGASTPESEDRCAEMAAQEIRDYLEKGIIRNSVNMPEIVLGMPEGYRVLIIHRNVAGVVSSISSLIAGRGVNIQNMLNKSRNDVAVTVLELSQAPDETLVTALSKLQNVIRVRVIE